MKKVTKSKLKAKMLEYFRHVEETGEELIVTSHDRPVLKVSALRERLTVQDVFGDLRGKLDLGDEILEPETAEWSEV